MANHCSVSMSKKIELCRASDQMKEKIFLFLPKAGIFMLKEHISADNHAILNWFQWLHGRMHTK